MVKRELISIEYLPCVKYTVHTLSHLIFTITREIGIIILILNIKMRFREMKQLAKVAKLIRGGARIWCQQYYNITNNSYHSLRVNFEGCGDMDLVGKHYYHNLQNNPSGLYIYAHRTNKDSGTQRYKATCQRSCGYWMQEPEWSPGYQNPSS